MNKETLRTRTRKELAALAKRKGVKGWSAMTKAQLVTALCRLANPRRRPGNGASPRNRRGANGKRVRSAAPKARRRATSGAQARRKLGAHASSVRDLTTSALADASNRSGQDRIMLVARDAHWMHACWELTRSAVRRAQAALGPAWHEATPVLRVFDVTSKDTTSITDTRVKDVEVHGGISNWYINVERSDRSYRVDVGYLPQSGRFYSLARSNVVHTPRTQAGNATDENWTRIQDEFQKVYAHSRGQQATVPASAELKALFEERLCRSMSLESTETSVSQDPEPGDDFWFNLDAELVVHGSTRPGAKVSLQGEQVSLRPDGTFTIRFSLPDSRQIIPAVASSRDGSHERTVVLAVERNTKRLEPVGSGAR